MTTTTIHIYENPTRPDWEAPEILTAAQRDRVRAMAADLRASEIEAIETAVREAAEGWTGCDWTTDGLDSSGESAEVWRAAADVCHKATRLGQIPEQIGGYERSDIFAATLDGETDEDGEEIVVDRSDREQMSLGEWLALARDVWGDEGASRLLQDAAELVESYASQLEEIEGAAKQAQDAGTQIGRHLRRGEWDDACALAREAVGYEAAYGDAPTWQPVLRLVLAYCGESR